MCVRLGNSSRHPQHPCPGPRIVCNDARALHGFRSTALAQGAPSPASPRVQSPPSARWRVLGAPTISTARCMCGIGQYPFLAHHRIIPTISPPSSPVPPASSMRGARAAPQPYVMRHTPYPGQLGRSLPSHLIPCAPPRPPPSHPRQSTPRRPAARRPLLVARAPSCANSGVQFNW